MIERTHNEYQHELTNPLSCQLWQTMHLNNFWTNPSHANLSCPNPPPHENEEQEVSYFVMNKPIPCQRGLTLYLNMCWLNTSHSSENTICISTCVEQIHHMLEKTQKVSQLMMTEPPLVVRKYISTFDDILDWYACKDTKSTSSWVDETHPMPART